MTSGLDRLLHCNHRRGWRDPERDVMVQRSR